MPELENLDFADDPLPTHGAADGQRMEWPKENTSMEEMLALAEAKKAELGASALAKPHEENSVPKLPWVGAVASSVNPAETAVRHEQRIGNPPQKRKDLVSGPEGGQKKKRKMP
ncbi:unnamed protein product [Rhizoctonia solani]|uniref:Uncharacterized protein n=1 Tax=Rhizoctonia solani TaxID=456999 RepID=A0A8H3C0G4_9AGAM